MATTTMSASNSSTIAKWEKKTWVEMLQQTAFGALVGSGSIFDASMDFRGDNGRGDNITFDYAGKLTDVPLGEGSVAYGNEEALDLGTHNMRINLTRIAVSNPNSRSIEQQRTNVDFSEVTARLQRNRAAELIDTSVFYQLAGANPTSFTMNGTSYTTAASKLQVQGHNTPTAPSTNRIIRAGAVAADQSLTSADTMSMDLVDIALEKISANDQPIEPCTDGYFKLFLHPYQVVDLRQDSGGKIQWYLNELAKEQGGKESMLFNANAMNNKPVLVGQYLNVKIYQAPRVAFGVSGADSSVVSSARRAVMVGKDALSFASPDGGLNPDGTTVPFKLFTQLSDYDYVKGQEFACRYGIKKMSPSNGEDIGSFVISTYAAAHG